MNYRKLTASLLSAVLAVSAALPANCALYSPVIPFAASAAECTVNAEEVTIYGLDSSYSEYLSIPDDLPQQFQIEVSGAENVSYYIKSGSSVKVSDSGLVTPNYSTFYWNGNIGYSTPTGAEGEIEERSGRYGTTVIGVRADGQDFSVSVTFADYADYNVQKVVSDYISENITDDMGIEEILDAVCRLPASYDYSPYASGAAGMAALGGGDCWASTDMILIACQQLGLNARVRNANRDPGAGSGHINALVEHDGVLYQLEAGYSGTAPRPYNVTVRDSLFCTKSVTGGVEIYQYDGTESNGSVIDIPDTLNGKPVVGIGAICFSLNDYITEIIIPDTVEYIGKSAFNSAEALEKLNIPSSVTDIGEFVFTGCTALTDFTCDADNPNYTVADGVLYDKEMKTILYVPSAASVDIPETVESIGCYSFYYNSNIRSVVIPENVKTIDEGAFGNCDNLAEVNIIGSGLQTISDHAFYKTALTELSVPVSVETIGERAMGYGNLDFIVYGKEGSAAQEYAETNELKFRVLSEPDVLYGDANCDGDVSVSDAVYILQTIADPSAFALSEQGELNADVYQTGSGVDAMDALSIQKFLADILPSLPESPAN